MKGAESMRKRRTVFLAVGIILLISSIVMIKLHVAPINIPVALFTIGCMWVVVAVGNFFAKCTSIRDEMVKRVEVLSGNYSFIASMYFLFALCFINYFFPLLLSTSGLLITMILFMSISFILIRQYLLRRGKA